MVVLFLFLKGMTGALAPWVECLFIEAAFHRSSFSSNVEVLEKFCLQF
jgi:hypothetical protein